MAADAAVAMLGHRPGTTVEEIAAAAGVSRQTVYAHFSSREGLLAAATEHVTQEIVAAIDGAALDEGPAAAALLRLVDAAWTAFERHLFVLAGSPAGGPESD